MKKLLICFLFTSSILIGMESENSIDIFNSQLNSIEATALLGYDPRIEVVTPAHLSPIANQNRPTIAVHGWGESKGGIIYRARLTQDLPGTIITYNAPDAPEQLGRMPTLSKTSFGQLSDITPFLYVLKKCSDAGIKTIDLNGHSRGAAVIVSGLAVLNDKLKYYEKTFENLNITPEKKQEIITMVENGCIMLQNPLTHVRSAIRKQLQSFTRSSSLSSLKEPTSNTGFFRSIINYLFEAGEVSSAVSIECTASTFTQYRPWAEQALNSAQLLAGLKLKILLHVEENDEVVGNMNDGQFYQALKQHNPEHTYFDRGMDGGHNHFSKDFTSKLHIFRRYYGAAFNPEMLHKTTNPDEDFSGKRLPSNMQ